VINGIAAPVWGGVWAIPVAVRHPDRKKKVKSLYQETGTNLMLVNLQGGMERGIVMHD
jgi:hypothetical protein